MSYKKEYVNELNCKSTDKNVSFHSFALIISSNCFTPLRYKPNALTIIYRGTPLTIIISKSY